MSQYENLNLAKSLAQSMGLTEYEVVYYAPASDSVLANAPRSAAALEWEEAAKSNSVRAPRADTQEPGGGAEDLARVWGVCREVSSGCGALVRKD